MIVFQKRIYRSDLRANPHVYYVFGDNVKRTGFGGQAKEMRGEPNAVGIATKWGPGREESDYFTDDRECLETLRRDYENIRFSVEDIYTIVVFPIDGIGTGLSELPQRAPNLFRYLQTLQLGGV